MHFNRKIDDPSVKKSRNKNLKTNYKQSNSSGEKIVKQQSDLNRNSGQQNSKMSEQTSELSQKVNRLMHSRDGFHAKRPITIKEFLNA